MVYCNHNHSHLIFVHKLNGSFYVRLFVHVGNQCGKCVRAAREVMEDELTTMPEFKEIA